MSIGRLLVGLAPWFAFSILTHRLGADSAGVAALAAVAVAAYLAVAHRRSGGSFDILEIGAVITFGAVAVVAFIGGQPTDDWLANYGRGAATVTLAAIMFVSVATVPFTERYAQAGVPEKYWQTSEFRSTNRKISLVWAAAVLVMGFGHLLAGAIDPLTHEYGVPGGAQPSRIADLVLNWGVPVAMILLAATYTNRAAAVDDGDDPLAAGAVGEPDPS